MSLHPFSKCFKLFAGRNLRATFLQPFRILSEGSDSSLNPSKDPVVMAIRAAPSAADVLKVASIHGRHMEAHQLVLSLGALQDIQNSRKSSMSDLDITQSQEFALLCKGLNKRMRTLEIADILAALKALTFFKVSFKSGIVQRLLHMLKNDVNSLSLNQITFLTFLLCKYPRDPVVDALKIALPIVLETHLFTKLDRKNVGALVDTLTFCTKNNLSQKCVDYIVTALNELDQLEWLTMDPRRARNIVISLAELRIDTPQYRMLFNDAAGVLCKSMDQLSFNEVAYMLDSVVKASRKFTFMLDLPMLEAIAETAVHCKYSLTMCCVLLRKLGSVGVVSRDLLNYMATLILENPEEFREGKFGMIKSFVSGLSVINYKTDHWNVLKDLIPSATCFHRVKPTEPWMPFCIELASLDIYCDEVISQVFSEDFLDEYLSREYNKLDLIQLLNLKQAVSSLYTDYTGPFPPDKILQQAMQISGSNVTDFPLQGVLEKAMGGPDYVLTRCFANNGQFIDHVVVLRRGGHAVAFPNAKSDDKVTIENLTLPSDCLKVAIRYQSPSAYNSYKKLRGVAALSEKILEAQGYVVVSVSQERWQNTPDWEKSPYLMQSIRLKSQQIYEESEKVAE